MVTHSASHTRRAGLTIRLLAVVVLVLSLLPFPTRHATGANPPPVQYYYVTLPEDDLLTLFDENQDTLQGYGQVVSPIRSDTSIAIVTTGMLIYWDQWEDGGYDADIANPGANVYNASTNPAGTQIWGDGILSNGCPPQLASGPNQCAVAADDQFVAGDVVILHNDVEVKTGVNYALDTFSAVAYNNQNGTNNWASDWVETGDNGLAASGDILITSNRLQFDNTLGGSVDAGDNITRQVNIPANGGVTVSSFARLKFNIGSSGVEMDGTDEFRADVYDGTTWTTLATFGTSAAPAASQSFDIGAYVNPTGNTRIRFYQVDALEAGEYWYVDDVRVEWGYYRDPAEIFFDGRDKVGATAAVAMSRGAFPPMPGSVMAGGTEMFDTSQWGMSYVAPVGEDTVTAYNSSFEDTRWFIMAGAGGATIDVDANGDGDVLDANDLNDFVMAEGSPKTVDGILDGATLTVVAGNPVQVNSMTADDDDIFEFRWDALVPLTNWSNDYVTPVGTTRTGAAGTNGCTEVWTYNPNAAQITINYDIPGGNAYPTADGSYTVAANSAVASPNVANLLTNDNGARFWTAGGQIFSPLSVTDCTRENSNGRLMDWGAPLVPVVALTSQALVGWAPGCSNESHSGICHDPDSTANGTTPDVTTEGSRNVVFANAVAATNIYVDTNGSGLTCTPGSPTPVVAGAEKTQIGATAMTSYRFNDDPTSRSYVHDAFASQAYNLSPAADGWAGNQTWTSNWGEGGGETPTSATAGAIQINTADRSTLRLQDLTGTSEAGRWIARTVNTSAASYARLSFELYSYSGLDANDRIALQVSTNGTTWSTLRTYVGPWNQTIPAPSFPRSEVFNITSYIANPTYIRFIFVDDLETGDWWAVDHVHIDYATGGDYDMSGALIESFNADCSGTPIAVAYGQYPSLTGGNDDEALDYGTLVPPFRPPVINSGSIGNYVWLDEDGDGDQDAGEAGIPNVKVTLTGTAYDGTVYNLTTYTDANGGYLFANIRPGSAYAVTVDQTTLPAGLAANPTYDENGIATPHTTTVSLAAGDEHLTADFGYNWSSPCETNTPGAAGCTSPTGAIGDRVWIDANGDGIQQSNEIGLAGVSVQLITAGTDGLFGTTDDVVAATTTTGNNGNYIFDGLAAGAYVVKIPTPPSGYTQTGDPDSTLDNKTTAAIVLAPGDDYLNADFGYQPGAGTFGAIGDTVWEDANRSGTQNAGEPGIPGVTVSLIKDLDGDGSWDAGEPIIATDTTDESGVYGFSGLPITDGAGTDDYLVWVNDTNHVLGEVQAFYDKDGTSPATGVVSGLGITAVTNLDIPANSTADTDTDFGYAPPAIVTGQTGAIGDTVWLDRDGGNDFDPGEGLEGVTVELFDSTGKLIAHTLTNEDGQYLFGGLPAGTYTVLVVKTTLPGSGVGLTNMIDPDLTPGVAGNNQSTVTITAGAVNLTRDFGYRPNGTQPINNLSGTIWEDTDANGTLSGEAGRFPNVTVALYADTNGDGVLDTGDNLVGTTSTDSGGNYAFNNLPNGTYFVDVTDENKVLNGYWKSNGGNPGADSNSQIDPYEVSFITPAGSTGTNVTADFGYYIKPAGLGDKVWYDVNNNGIQNAGEPGLAGITVTLTITWPSGGTTVLKTQTDANGIYSFKNLLLDEDYTGAGSGQPTYAISVATPPGYPYASPAGQGSDRSVDSGLATGETITTTKGSTNTTYDYGFRVDPTAVKLLSFTATAANVGVKLSWQTASEIDTLGFNLYRAKTINGQRAKINGALIPTKAPPGKLSGALYSYKDATTKSGVTYYYWLQSVDVDGSSGLYGPVTSKAK